MYECPKCKELFEEPGYCPHDRSALEAIDQNEAFGSDDRSTRGSTGTLTGSAVQNVLSGLLETRKAERLIGVELDGRYRIEEQIGEGGMGVVFLARHMVIEKAVAIKVLRAEVAEDEAVVKRFVQEARAASRIGHPNIIDVTDFGTTKDGLTYQVMEYLEGRTLAALLLEEKTLTLSRALTIVAQMARALGAAHDKGIVHRDLKPENVFLMSRDGRDDFVKIVDFGIAKVQPNEGDSSQPRLTRVGTVFGTPEYMSPEQASGRTDVDLRADVYALGVILYEMLCGRVPLRGDTTVRTLAMQMLDDPEPIREAFPEVEITAEQESVIMRALEKKRADRYQSMAEFLTALEDVTTHTELDLPRVMQEERVSADMLNQRAFDTVPEANLAENAPSHTQAKTAPIDVAALSADQSMVRKRRPSRATDPVFLRETTAKIMPDYDSFGEEEDFEALQTGAKPWMVILALLLIGGGVGAYVLTRDAKTAEHASANVHDAALVALTNPADAAMPPLPITDSGALENSDAKVAAAVIVTRPGKNPINKLPEIKNPGNTPPDSKFRPTLQVTVHSKPSGASLYSGDLYSGPDGVTIERRQGETLKLKCHLKGYKDGTVIVKFDGKSEIYQCKMRKKRVKKCLDGVKNPFDDCP